MPASSLSSACGDATSSADSFAMSAVSASCCELTDTNSPTAIDIAPAVSPATPATRTPRGETSAAATPIISDEVDTIASLEPSTAARSQPPRPDRCRSRWRDTHGAYNAGVTRTHEMAAWKQRQEGSSWCDECNAQPA